ncbi:MAG TPA: hypothetical protein VKC62_11035 [Gaiellaceae bacterium]|nr:hypothetical protein [Gaiellaceae bacterium]
MARKKTSKPKLDRAQEKARKQKRLAIVLGGVLLLVLVYEVPHTMKLMNKKAKAPVVETTASAPRGTATSPAVSPTPSAAAQAPSAAAPAPTATSTSGLVSSVNVTPDPGQLTEFARFASKDPFSQSVQKTTGAASGGTASTPTKAKTKQKIVPAPKTPPAPAPTTAVISLNGELMSVTVGTPFPMAGQTYDRVGSLFEIATLTDKSAKVSIVGGSYADGTPMLTLTVGKPVTLQNTADGTRYTLTLEPQGTQVPATTTASPTTPTATTPSVVPPSPGG